MIIAIRTRTDRTIVSTKRFDDDDIILIMYHKKRRELTISWSGGHETWKDCDGFTVTNETG